jgi:hypothetical protein
MMTASLSWFSTQIRASSVLERPAPRQGAGLVGYSFHERRAVAHVGTLIGLGIPEDKARSYERAFEAGHTLVTVLADERYPEVERGETVIWLGLHLAHNALEQAQGHQAAKITFHGTADDAAYLVRGDDRLIAGFAVAWLGFITRRPVCIVPTATS